VKIERVDPAGLDMATAVEAAAITRAQLAIEAPNAIPPSAEGMLLAARYGFDDSPFDALWLVRSDAGELVGHASLEVSHWDNPTLAFVFCGVRPEALGTGVGTALLGAQVDAARELGRSSLLTFTPRDGHAAHFLAASGFAVGQHNAQRRLLPQRLDYTHIAGLAVEAAEKAADYELVHLAGPASEEMLPSLTSVFEAINDAPLDDIAMERTHFSPRCCCTSRVSLVGLPFTSYSISRAL